MGWNIIRENYRWKYVNKMADKIDYDYSDGLDCLVSRDMMRDRSFAANISIANTRICEKCFAKLDKYRA